MSSNPTQDPVQANAVDVTSTDVSRMLERMIGASLLEDDSLLSECHQTPAVQRTFEALRAGRLDAFDLFTRYQMDKMVSAMVLRMYPGRRDAVELLKGYSFYANHFRYWIERTEGRGCCADKSGHIMRQLFRHLSADTPMDLGAAEPKEFWKTSTIFVHSDEVLRFFKALSGLRFGRPDAYLAEIAKLVCPGAALSPDGAPETYPRSPS